MASYDRSEAIAAGSRDEALVADFLRGVYGWMCGGLAITAGTAWIVANSPSIARAIFTNRLLFWAIVIAQFGIVITRDDGTVYTLADRIARHYTTAMATLRTASENREGLLQYTYEMMRKQVASGQNTYLILPNAPNFRPLVEMLQRQQIVQVLLN